MRIPLLIGLLLSGCAAYSQTPKFGADNATKPWRQSVPQQTPLDQLPPAWHVDLRMPLQLPPNELSKAASFLNPAIDSRSIVHPPQANLGLLSPATPILQKQYPGLTFLPIDAEQNKQEARLEAIPTEWPMMKIDAIPKRWPDLKLQETTKPGSSQHQPGVQ